MSGTPRCCTYVFVDSRRFVEATLYVADRDVLQLLGRFIRAIMALSAIA